MMCRWRTTQKPGGSCWGSASSRTWRNGPRTGRAGCGFPRAPGGLAALEDVVAGAGGGRDVRPLSRDRAEAARLVVLERLDQLGPGVHDERAVGRDRLADRLAAEHQDVQLLAGAVH